MGAWSASLSDGMDGGCFQKSLIKNFIEIFIGKEQMWKGRSCRERSLLSFVSAICQIGICEINYLHNSDYENESCAKIYFMSELGIIRKRIPVHGDADCDDNKQCQRHVQKRKQMVRGGLL